MVNTTDIEADLCGVAILEPTTTNLPVDGHQFSSSMLGDIWDATRALHRQGVQPDPAGIVRAALPHRVDHAVVVDLIGRYGIGANAPVYAEQIVGRWHRDRLALAVTKARQQLDNDETPVDAIVSDLSKAFGSGVEDEAMFDQTLTLDDFCAQPLPPNDWIIPDLLSKGDRVIVTGSEGAGKSILMRQFAVCVAAGVHPFTTERIKPARVLVIDAENPLRIMVNTYQQLRSEVLRRNMPTDDRLWIHRFPQGLNLDKPSDRLKLHSLCRVLRPDLLVIGPAYKLYVGGSNQREEDLARMVTSALDGLREEFGFGLILEHHSPHGAPGVAERSVRPIGSSLWMRWPEFGVGLRLDAGSNMKYRSASLIHWRGQREEREWPERIESGTGFPWTEAPPSDRGQR